jgi:WD domain, G-beta repeat
MKAADDYINDFPRFPYPGLRPFRAFEASIFFGRNAQKDAILELLNHNQMVFITGPSGCGKSSLIKAGVIPALRAGLLTKVGYRWRTVEMRPGQRPLVNLAAALRHALSEASRDGDSSKTDIMPFLKNHEAGLWTVASMIADAEGANTSGSQQNTRCLLLIDQFEEVFGSQSKDNNEVDRFVRLLATQYARPHPYLFIVFTMRSDFLGRCANFPGLADAVNNCQYLTPILTANDLREAIVGPAADYGAKVSDELVHQILGEMQTGVTYDADNLPLMQHALLWLWLRATDIDANAATAPATTLVLGVDDYRKFGGMRGILNHRADEVLHQTAGQGGQDSIIIETVFRRLSERDSEGRYRRCPTQLAELASVAQCSNVVLRQAIEPFTDERVSFLEIRTAASVEEEFLDISHEALIRKWDKARAWVDLESEKVRIFKESVRSAETWREEHENPEFLMRGLKLVNFEKWWHEEAPTVYWAKRYLDAGTDAAMNLLRCYRLACIEADRREEAGRVARQKAQDAEKERELVHLRAIADERKKVAQRTAAGLIGATLFALAAIGAAFLAREQASIAALQTKITTTTEALSRYNFIDLRIDRLRSDQNRQITYAVQLRRDAARGLTGRTKKEIDTLADAAEGVRVNLQAQVAALAQVRSNAIRTINQENETLGSTLGESGRQQVVSTITHVLEKDASLNPETRLRVALYAVAAIPMDDDNLVKILHDAIAGFRLRGFFKPPGASKIWGLAVNPKDAHQAAAGDDNGVVWMWDPFMPDRGYNKYLTAAGGAVNSLAFNTNGTLLAGAYRDSGVAVWDIASGKQVCPFLRDIAGVGAYAVAFSGSLLAVASGNSIQLWDLLREDQCIQRPNVFHRNDVIYGVAFSSDGSLLAAASGDGTVAVWNIDEPQVPFKEFDTGKRMFAVGFSGDGGFLAAAAANGEGHIWNRSTWKANVLPSHDGTVAQIAFSRDGSRVIATASTHGVAIISDSSTGEEVLRLNGNREDVFGVAYSPDSTYVLTGHLDGLVGVWVTGSNNIDVSDRASMIALGLERMPEIRLVSNECALLQSMLIPIFEFANRNWKQVETRESCSLPFLR